MQQLVENYHEQYLGKVTPAYDGRKNLFTGRALPFSSKEFLVKLVDRDEETSSSGGSARWNMNFKHALFFLRFLKCYVNFMRWWMGYCWYRKKRDREFKVTIRFASKPDLHHLMQFLGRQQLDSPQETIQALDVVLRATPSMRYHF